jgi:hypothetical protein
MIVVEDLSVQQHNLASYAHKLLQLYKISYTYNEKVPTWIDELI